MWYLELSRDTATKPFTAQDIRFTTKGEDLYAMALGWPKDGHLTIHALGAPSNMQIRAVSLLGSQDEIKWSQGTDGLELDLPARAPGNYAYSFSDCSPAALVF